jgi:hypothetical protein
MLVNDLSPIIPLDGPWEFSLGENAPWGAIQVPGCWDVQGFSKYIEGPARYSREFEIPESWRNRQIYLEFDAVSYVCEIFVNGSTAGSHIGLWTPFSVDLTPYVRYDKPNTLELSIYKPGERYPMRSSLAGFLPDVATTFGGIWQPVRLRAHQAGLKDFFVDSDPANGKLYVSCQVDFYPDPENPRWLVEVTHEGKLVRHLPLPFDKNLDVTLEIPSLQTWRPENPALYTVTLSLLDKRRLSELNSNVLSDDEFVTHARVSARTGFRQMTTSGNQLLLNGIPFMVRGILSWGWEPDQIAPAYTPDQARAEFRRVKQMGFNLVKLCLFVPNQAYFDIADEEGMLLWEELPMWLPEVTPELRQQAPVEYAEITRAIRRHPSVVIYSLGCELSASVDEPLLNQLNQVVRAELQFRSQVLPGQQQHVLVCDNSGSGESYAGLDVDFADFSDYHPYYDIHYFEPLLDNWRRDWKAPRPWIFGEFCDSDTFRNLDAIIQENNGQRPWWLTADNPVTVWRSESKAMLEASERLARANLPFSPQEITRISYAQSQVTRKYTLETLRRRSGMGGYIITGLRDTPISTSGIWDDFYRPKWSAEEFMAVNGEGVLSLEVGRRRVWRHGGDRPERLDAHNFWSGDHARWHVIASLYDDHSTAGPLPADTILRWSLLDSERKIIKSDWQTVRHTLPAGAPGEVAVISTGLPEVVQVSQFILQVSLGRDRSNPYSNQWPVWVYPVPERHAGEMGAPFRVGILDPHHDLDDWGAGDPPLAWFDQLPRLEALLDSYELLISTVWDHDMLAHVREGGRVLLFQQGSGPLPAIRCPFWREAIKLFYPHPLWELFQHPGYTDMQFFGLASDVAFDSQRILETIPGINEFNPVLRRLDARQFLVSDYLFEAQIGAGTLLACSLRLRGGMGAQPSGLQRNVAGGALFNALINTMLTKSDPRSVNGRSAC